MNKKALAYIELAGELNEDIGRCNEEVRLFGRIRKKYRGDLWLRQTTGRILKLAIQEKENLLSRKEQYLNIGARLCGSAIISGQEETSNFLQE